MKELTSEEYRKINLEELKFFHNFCVSHGLRYSLFYGTLLGAIRHSGFIPWDDDIDVAMPREDYEKFLLIFNDDRYKVNSYKNNKNHYLPWAKLYDSTTTKIENISNKNYELGVDIDIFPIDLAKNKNSYPITMMKIWFFNKIRAASISKYTKNPIRNLLILLSRNKSGFASEKIDKAIISLGKRHKTILFTYDLFNKKLEKYDADIFEEIISHPFEGFEFNICKKYDHVLKIEFGDYMTPPPIEERVPHHDFEAYYKEI